MKNKQKVEIKKFYALRAFIYFVISYVVSSILATVLSVSYGIINNSAQPAPGESILKAPAFQATVPWHVLIMLVVWTFFAVMYFKKRAIVNADHEVNETVWLSVTWVFASMATDFICYVLPNSIPMTKNAYSFTVYDFYVNYQPWLSLIYFAIFLSPWTRLGLSRMRAKT